MWTRNDADSRLFLEKQGRKQMLKILSTGILIVAIMFCVTSLGCASAGGGGYGGGDSHAGHSHWCWL